MPVLSLVTNHVVLVLSSLLEESRVLEQWTVHIIVFELAKYSDIIKLGKPSLLLLALKLLNKVLIVHCYHPLY